jgi:hypothetical protein
MAYRSIFVMTLLFCGTVCVLAPLGICFYVIKQMATMMTPLLVLPSRFPMGILFIPAVAAPPGLLSFIAGAMLLRVGIRTGTSIPIAANTTNANGG